MKTDKIKEELKHFEPTEGEKRLDAIISFYYVVALMVLGLPMWYLATTTYRATLPLTDIKSLVTTRTIIAVKINVISFDGKFDVVNLGEMERQLFDDLRSNFSYPNNDVGLSYYGYVRHASEKEMATYLSSGSLADLRPLLAGCDEDAITVLLMDRLIDDKGLIGSSTDRVVVYLRCKNEQCSSVIRTAVTSALVRHEDFVSARRAALDVPQKENLRELPRRIRRLLTRARSAAGYNWVFSLIIPYPNSTNHVGPQWDFPSIEHQFLEPLLRTLLRFIKVRVSSQIIYGVRLESLWPRNNNRYSRDDLTHVVNGLEVYLGPSDGLHFVAYKSSTPIQLQDGHSAFTVPRWGGVLILNGSTGLIDGHRLMATFLPQIRDLMGLTDSLGARSLPVEATGDPRSIASRQLHGWLRERTVENIAMTQLTVQSVTVLLDKVANMVIRDDVAAAIRRSVTLAQDALDALADASLNGGLQVAFVASKQALESAEFAFFHPSLLELLYFQDDQKYGIYIPLFVPILLPLVLSFRKIRQLLNGSHKHKVE